jgi:hypothetical protein
MTKSACTALHRPRSGGHRLGDSTHMITDEQKRQFGELAVGFSENLERGAHANLEALADQWLALEVKVRRVVCNDEVLSWFSEIRFERPVTLH